MEEAKKILARFHSRDNDVESPLIQLEIEEIEEYVKVSIAVPRIRWFAHGCFPTYSFIGHS